MSEAQNLSSMLWVLIILLFLFPVLQQRWITRIRRKFIRNIEKKFNSRVIVLIHRQEILSLFGLPFFRYISIEDSEQILRAIRKTDPDSDIDFILHTPGGLVLASVQIAQALKRHKGKVRVHIPHLAMSGGTLIALAADEIYMYEGAVLGPVDPQIERFPAASILEAVARKNIDRIEDKTLIFASLARKALTQLQLHVQQLLEGNMSKEASERLARLLSQGTWTHDYPIIFEEAKDLGLPVRTDIPKEIFELMELYPQPHRRQVSVEYGGTPLPRKKTESDYS